MKFLIFLSLAGFIMNAYARNFETVKMNEDLSASKCTRALNTMSQNECDSPLGVGKAESEMLLYQAVSQYLEGNCHRFVARTRMPPLNEPIMRSDLFRLLRSRFNEPIGNRARVHSQVLKAYEGLINRQSKCKGEGVIEGWFLKITEADDRDEPICIEALDTMTTSNCRRDSSRRLEAMQEKLIHQAMSQYVEGNCHRFLPASRNSQLNAPIVRRDTANPQVLKAYDRFINQQLSCQGVVEDWSLKTPTHLQFLACPYPGGIGRAFQPAFMPKRSGVLISGRKYYMCGPDSHPIGSILRIGL